MQFLAKLIAIGAPITLGVFGAIAAFTPTIAQSRWRHAWIATFIVMGVGGAFATYVDGENLRAIITGGDNYCFIVPATTKFGTDGQVQLAMVNRGDGAVIQIRYWIYESPSPAGPDSAAYLDGRGAGLPWSNPRSNYRLPIAASQGHYMAEIEALNGLVLEELEIAKDGDELKYEVVVTRAGGQIYRRRFDGTEETSVVPALLSFASLAAVSAWPWPMISSIVGLASLLVGGSALFVITLVNVWRPRKRKQKLRAPAHAYFVIPKAPNRQCDYAAQDNEEHRTNEIVLSPHAEVVVHLVYRPHIAFRTTQVYFGCDPSPEGGEPPKCLEYFNTFISTGRRQHVVPGPGTDDYIDVYGYYHVLEEKSWSVGGWISYAFKMRTRGPGLYTARTFFVGEEVLGTADLTIRVEETPHTPMRCVISEHSGNPCSSGMQPRSTHG